MSRKVRLYCLESPQIARPSLSLSASACKAKRGKMKNTSPVLFLLMTLFIILARGLRNSGGETRQAGRKSVKEESGHALAKECQLTPRGSILISQCFKTPSDSAVRANRLDSSPSSPLLSDCHFYLSVEVELISLHGMSAPDSSVRFV